MSSTLEKRPILLLKTKSIPTDAYDELFSTPRDGFDFEPTFVPVLQHQFEEDGMNKIRKLVQEKSIGRDSGAAYGGLIFTSQRAVEAFAKLVGEGQGAHQSSISTRPRKLIEGVGNERWPHLQGVPIYSVGPATTRSLRAIPQTPPLEIFGEHTGNGDALAHYILEHYGQWYADRPTRPPLLFLVGEQRRDIIPKTLMDPNLPSEQRVEVVEVVVYGTGVMASFLRHFQDMLQQTAERPMRWVVVFSPTGCDSMLKGLGILNEETGKVGRSLGRSTTYIATIGPTTRDYLKRTFDYEPDVCSEKPSPEGIWESITRFIESEK
jgi:uroporphyrinogen-III synthase